ncbi:hypothetical protein AAG570_000301 [Ranatra chinensis]|uniref:WH2 domain-containing protein n=1 Tax=Ranatra chinensis TaxID=642074 RepID=A0ABD0ZJY8_9HEMI
MECAIAEGKGISAEESSCESAIEDDIPMEDILGGVRDEEKKEKKKSTLRRMLDGLGKSKKNDGEGEPEGKKETKGGLAARLFGRGDGNRRKKEESGGGQGSSRTLGRLARYVGGGGSGGGSGGGGQSMTLGRRLANNLGSTIRSFRQDPRPTIPAQPSQPSPQPQHPAPERRPEAGESLPQ